MAVNPKITIGTMIKLMRESEGWSQEELADAMKVSRDHLSKVERGKTLPSLHLIEKLAVAFGSSGVELHNRFITRLKNQGVYDKWVSSRLR